MEIFPQTGSIYQHVKLIESIKTHIQHYPNITSYEATLLNDTKIADDAFNKKYPGFLLP